MPHQCQHIKPGVECSFWHLKRGCTFGDGACAPIVENCVGCEHVREFATGKYCVVYAEPSFKWSVGACNFATHVKSENVQQARMLNPLKASKRAARAK